MATIQELENKIALKCLHCHKLRRYGGRLECGRRRSNCHLKTVKRWIKELEELDRSLTNHGSLKGK